MHWRRWLLINAMTSSSASDGWVNRDPSGHIDTRSAATADIDDDDCWRSETLFQIERHPSTEANRRRRKR